MGNADDAAGACWSVIVPDQADAVAGDDGAVLDHQPVRWSIDHRRDVRLSVEEDEVGGATGRESVAIVAELGLPTGMSPKVALLIAGSVAVDSRPELVGSLALVALANLLGAVVLHTVARTGGTRLLARLHRGRAGTPGDALTRWRDRLGGYDAPAVFVGRILPLVRLYVTVASGLVRMRWRSFLLGTAPAALIWSGTPLLLGYCFRTSVHDFAASGSTVSRLLFLAVPMIGVVVLATLFLRRRFGQSPAPS